MLALGAAVSLLALGDAVSALALGADVSLLMPGDALADEVVPSTGLFAIEMSVGEDVEAGSLLDAVSGAGVALLFDAVFVTLVVFFGALLVSVVATSEEEVVLAGAGATSAREPVSAAAGGGAWSATVALVSFAGKGDAGCNPLALATVGAAMTLPSMR